jgi:hypothetical protein
MSNFIYLYQSGSVSPSSQSVPSSSSHSFLTSPSSSLPIYNMSSSVPFTALDVQHILEPFTVTSFEMRRHAIMIHMDDIIHLHFLVFKLTETHADSRFSPQMALMVLRILNMCILVFCSVCGLVSLSSRLFCNF